LEKFADFQRNLTFLGDRGGPREGKNEGKIHSVEISAVLDDKGGPQDGKNEGIFIHARLDFFSVYGRQGRPPG
jgi:hypothetical protein